MTQLLTKSKYLAGLECSRHLWSLLHDKEKIPEPTIAEKFLMDQGIAIGKLATQLFSNGINLTNLSFYDNIAQSKKAIKEKRPIFEAGFIFDNCFSRADILMPTDDVWDIIEVKASTSLKEANIHDVSFQKYCYEGAGLKIRNCYILHLNKDYIRNGQINMKELFTQTDITLEVDALMTDIQDRIESLVKVINLDNPPKIHTDHKCNGPNNCPLKDCWDFLPEHHVFQLYRIGKKGLELFENGVQAIRDIPEEFILTDKQNIQRTCDIEGKVHINKKEIKEFIDVLKYPLHFLDFETFSTAVPKFNGLRPYSHVPFQFSLHIIKEQGHKPEHYEFLYKGNGDPRKEFAGALKSVLSNTGSIITYSQSFESSRLKDLAEAFPEHKQWVKELIPRLVDLLLPFRNFSYYNPVQKGSASLKKVLPAITGKGYEGMEIADGGTASVEFFNMAYNGGKDVRKALLKYCELDTLAEVMIVDKLANMVKG